jgi:hypothetical protein
MKVISETGHDYRGGWIYLWLKPEYPEKITNGHKALANFIT